MRKYFLFLLSFLLLSSFTGTYHTMTAYAVGETGACVIDETTPPDQRLICADGVCNAPPECDPGLRCVANKCIKPDGSSTLKCKCKSPNDRGPGANGFACSSDGNIDFNNFDVDKNGAYCEPNYVCAPETDMNVDNPDDHLKTKRGEEKYPGKILLGAKCIPNTAIARCKCVGPQGTDKQNKMECELADNPAKKGTAFCGSTQDQCVNTQNPDEALGGEDLVSNKEGPLFGDHDVQIVGVKCSQPVGVCYCKNPGQSGARRNGMVCKQIVGGRELVDTDYCPNTTEACIDNPNATITHSYKNIFGNAPLKGVECKVTPPSPPPPPPCADPFDAQGKCLAFNSAFGKISTDAGPFITSVFAVLLSTSGGFALLLIMRSGYLMMISAGKPDTINAAREQLTAAIVGLLFIIFSFVLLQVIGIDILRVPGFGQTSGGGAPTTGSPGSRGSLGGVCDFTGNTQCAQGLTCVPDNTGRRGTCKQNVGAPCDANANNQCPSGQRCVTGGGSRIGTCQP